MLNKCFLFTQNLVRTGVAHKNACIFADTPRGTRTQSINNTMDTYVTFIYYDTKVQSICKQNNRLTTRWRQHRGLPDLICPIAAQTRIR